MKSLSEEVFHRQTKKRSQIPSKQDNPCKKMSNHNIFSMYSFDVYCSKGHRQKPLWKCSFSPQTVGEGVTNLLLSARNCLPPDMWKIPPHSAQHDLQFNCLQWHELIRLQEMLDILHNDGFKRKILTKTLTLLFCSVKSCKPSQRKTSRKFKHEDIDKAWKTASLQKTLEKFSVSKAIGRSFHCEHKHSNIFNIHPRSYT